MEEENNGVSPTSTETTVEESTTEETETSKNTEVSADEIAELKKRAELAENYKIRAEKAERRLKEPSKKEEELNLTTKDTIALVNAKVNTEDFDTVTEWAKFKKIPVHEALKDKTLQTVLREKEDERRTAEATITKGAMRGGQKVEPEEIIARASKGLTSDDDSDIDQLVNARMQMKFRKLNK